MEGQHDFDVSAGALYELLLDPAVLAGAMPGTKRLVRNGDRYDGTMDVGIGPISAAEFALTVVVTDQVPGERYTMHIDARGKLGFVSGTAKVSLAADGLAGETRMTYRADLQVGGTLAAVGQRMLDSVSKTMSAQALKAFDRAVRARSTGARV